jgi:hypothetical protein
MGRKTLDLRPPRKRFAPEAVVPFPADDRPPEIPVTAGPVPHHFGEWLLQSGLVSQDQLQQALSVSRKHDWRIGDSVVLLRFASRARVEAEARRFERSRACPDRRRIALEYRLRRMEQSRKSG